MTDKTNSANSKTVTVNLDVINDECTPNLDIDSISINSSYDYIIGDSPLEITGLENFSCGDCESDV